MKERMIKSPRLKISELEILSSSCYLMIWAARTHFTLEQVLEAGFFDEVKESGMRPQNRIEILASCNSAAPEHATLV